MTRRTSEQLHAARALDAVHVDSIAAALKTLASAEMKKMLADSVSPEITSEFSPEVLGNRSASEVQNKTK